MADGMILAELPLGTLVALRFLNYLILCKRNKARLAFDGKACLLNRESERIPRRLRRGKRGNSKKDRIPYGRRFPAACCRDLQFFF
jgi:hypothetical protein